MTLRAYLINEKREYLLGEKEHGGQAEGFRKRISAKFQEDSLFFTSLALESALEAATKEWEKQPRAKGPDLFSINGYTIPEFLTRPRPEADTDPNTPINEHGPDYDKVAQEYATVQDLYDYGYMKMRIAAQTGAVAERTVKAADVARRRAKGDLSARLADLVDKVEEDAAD